MKAQLGSFWGLAPGTDHGSSHSSAYVCVHRASQRDVFLSKMYELSPAEPQDMGLAFPKLNPVHSDPGAGSLLQSEGSR